MLVYEGLLAICYWSCQCHSAFGDWFFKTFGEEPPEHPVPLITGCLIMIAWFLTPFVTVLFGVLAIVVGHGGLGAALLSIGSFFLSGQFRALWMEKEST